MDTQVYKLKIRLLNQMLGTVPKNKEIYKDFIQKKAREEGVPEEELSQELESVQEMEEKGWTGFHQDNEGLFILSHMIRGFLKEAGNVLKDQIRIKNLKSKVNNYVFVFPRKIYLNKSAPDGVLERPLRAMTAQGPRVSLTKSDFIKEDTEFECEIHLLTHSEITEKTLRTILEYGKYQGLGQWRNANYGAFEAELVTA